MDAAVLAHVLRDLPPIADPNVLVATSTADDAGVYRLSDELALVLTVDFFTPIVDDPRTYGRIAAANSLSDVYAMGGRPLTALAIAAFPEDAAADGVLADILAGGAEKAAEAGIAVIGGHTVKDPEPKYGLSVVGCVHPKKVVRNSTGRAGDALILTKPLGTGILTTARRRDLIGDSALQPAIVSMEALNRAASEAMCESGVNAATDITGFGLLGHLTEMAAGSGCAAEIAASSVPALPGALELAEEAAPGGTRSNLDRALDRGVRFDAAISESSRLLLCDAQTSGGLLIAVASDRCDALLQRLSANGVTDARRIGRLTVAAIDGAIRVVG